MVTIPPFVAHISNDGKRMRSPFVLNTNAVSHLWEGIRFERKVLNCLQMIIPKNQCHCVLKLYDQTSFKKSFRLYISVSFICCLLVLYLHRTYTCVSVSMCMYSLYLHMYYHLGSVTFFMRFVLIVHWFG